MSEYSAKTLRDKAKARARNLAKPGDYTKDQMTSSADWRPAEPIKADVKTGARPISPRNYRRGGAVKKASGGEIADAIVKRDTKKVIGTKEHVGGFMCGGKAKRATGGRTPEPTSGYDVSNYGEADAAKKIHQGLKDKRAGRDPGAIWYDDKPYVSGTFGETPRKTGGAAKRASGGGVLDKKAVGAVEVLPKREKAQHYAKGGKANWIAGAIKNKGALHRDLGVPAGEKIPAKKLAKAADKPGKVGQRARLAETLKGFKKADGGGLADKLNKLTGYKSESQRQQENMPNPATRKGVDYGDPAMKGDRDRLDRMSSPYKKGGRTARATGGAANLSPLSSAAKAVGKASGGARKGGKTAINIVINAGKKEPPMPIDLGGGAPGAPAPAPAMMPPPPPAAMGATGVPPMARRDGGKVSKIASSYKNLTAGSGSGNGRLQKAAIEKKGGDAPKRKSGGSVKK